MLLYILHMQFPSGLYMKNPDMTLVFGLDEKNKKGSFSLTPHTRLLGVHCYQNHMSRSTVTFGCYRRYLVVQLFSLFPPPFLSLSPVPHSLLLLVNILILYSELFSFKTSLSLSNLVLASGTVYFGTSCLSIK